jgi:hypothetical protein
MDRVRERESKREGGETRNVRESESEGEGDEREN